MKPIRIFYFSDILCIWAYIAQVRLEELKIAFPENVVIDYHFLPVFGNAREKLENGWRDRGGLTGYQNHVKAIANKFEHISIHPDVWSRVPASSTSTHLFLNAIQMLEIKGLVPESDRVLEKTAWAFREAFFTRLVDISDLKVQLAIAEELELDINLIQAQIDSGEAYALLSKDLDLIKEYQVTVSPTLIFNEGRQRLNGNVGYRVIEANIRELLHNPTDEQSWC